MASGRRGDLTKPMEERGSYFKGSLKKEEDFDFGPSGHS